MSATDVSVTPDRREHVVLFAMVRWFAKKRTLDYTPVSPDIVPSAPALRDEEGPVRFYPKNTVSHVMSRLHEKGLVERIKYHGKVLGWRLSEEGLEVVAEMGRPKQYDH